MPLKLSHPINIYLPRLEDTNNPEGKFIGVILNKFNIIILFTGLKDNKQIDNYIELGNYWLRNYYRKNYYFELLGRLDRIRGKHNNTAVNVSKEYRLEFNNDYARHNRTQLFYFNLPNFKKHNFYQFSNLRPCNHNSQYKVEKHLKNLCNLYYSVDFDEIVELVNLYPIVTSNFKLKSTKIKTERMQPGEWAYGKYPCLTLFKVGNLINQIKTRYSQIVCVLKGYQLEPNSYSYSTQFKYWSTIYILLFDILSGSIVGYYLNHNKEYAGRLIVKVIGDYTLKLPQKIVSWLKEYPVGLKLNSKLAYFLSRLFSWSIINWNTLLLTTLKPHCPDLIALIAFSGFIGLSFCLSLSCDILSVSLLHTHWFYLVARKIFYWHQAVLISLYYLFLGKKWNPLRQRVDLGDYRSGHIIIGSILFTFLIFLFPSILIYYTTFTLGWVLIYCSQGVFIFFINCLNVLPAWGYLARFYQPQRFYTGFKLSYAVNLVDLYYTIRSIESNYCKYSYYNQDLVNNFSYLKSNYFNATLIKKYIRGDLIFKK